MGSSGFGRKSDKADLSAVIGLAAMGGAAKAVEAIRVGIGVEARARRSPRSRRHAGDARHSPEGRNGACRPETARRSGRSRHPARGNVRGSPRRPRSWPGRCTGRSRRECGRRDAPSSSIAAIVASVTPARAPRQPACAAPMTPASASANSTGAQSAVRMPSSRSGRSVTMASACGPLVLRPGMLDIDDTRANGSGARSPARRTGQNRGDRAAAIFVDRRAVVAAAVTDVEPGELAGRDAAAPAEEAVRDAAERRRADDLDVAHSSLRMMMSSSAWPPTMNVVGREGREPIAVIEAPRAMIVGEDRKVELRGPTRPCLRQRPLHQRRGDAGAVMVLEDVKLFRAPSPRPRSRPGARAGRA